MRYDKHKRAQIDVCNICGKMSNLTWDHVPPKHVIYKPNVYSDILFDKAELPRTNRFTEHNQSGIKYRTICANCNNVVLGKNDMAFKEFMDLVLEKLDIAENAFDNGLVISPKITVDIKINRVLRAICGHFLAMKQEYDSFTLADKLLRPYVLDETATLDRESVLCWFYPYGTVLNFRDMTSQGYNPKTHPKGTFSVMAFYPLAFMISTNDESECWMDNLSSYATSSIDEIISVTLHFNTVFYRDTNRPKHLQWPVDISNKEPGAMMAMANSETMKGSRLGVNISEE